MPIIYRRGTPNDSRQTFDVFRKSIMDLGDRLSVMPISGGNDPRVIQDLWERRQSLFDHLARTSDNFWVAELDGEVIGLARSILRDDVRQLTEFFVLPGHQSAGVGRELLTRAFPSDGAKHRFILATIDGRALPRYLKAKVYPLFPCYAFARPAEKMDVKTDLEFEVMTLNDATLGLLNEIDKEILGYQRELEHRWLIENREGYLYRRAGKVVGYGYVGEDNGPFALLASDDYPAVLAHAETKSAERDGRFFVELPLVNRVAVDYLLERGCKMDSFFEFFMADAPFGKFENYILTSPPFFV